MLAGHRGVWARWIAVGLLVAAIAIVILAHDLAKKPKRGRFLSRRPGLGIGTYGSLAAARADSHSAFYRQPRGLAAIGHPQ